jgi:hypothetical protein
VELDIDWGDNFTVLVFDTSGLITGGRQFRTIDGPHPGGSAAARPDRSEIDVAWIGGACTHRPTVTIAGTAQSLLITVDNVQDELLPFQGCPSIGLPFGVTLSLSAPVAQEAITLEFTP